MSTRGLRVNGRDVEVEVAPGDTLLRVLRDRLHLTGAKDYDKVVAAYREAKAPAVVRPFLTEMELALNAATVAVSRSGGKEDKNSDRGE